MQLTALRKPLVEAEIALPQISPSQVLLKIECCGVCRTDVHIINADLPAPQLPLIPGHQIIGTVRELGSKVEHLSEGDRVGVPWLAHTCGSCHYCHHDQENLCDHADFTGYTVNGGFAEYCAAEADYCFPLAEKIPAPQAAPLMCAGLIGYRALTKLGDATNIGLYGFGAAAHILCQVAAYQSRKVFAFTRQGDSEAQQLALSLGAQWAGSSTERAPLELDAAIIFAPIGWLIPQALKNIRKGGKVICAGIHMSQIPAFSYDLLWGEREISSVANLTREDGRAFLNLAAEIPIKSEVFTYPLEQVNFALSDILEGRLSGAAVVLP